jgi:hypothetical protein
MSCPFAPVLHMSDLRKPCSGNTEHLRYLANGSIASGGLLLGIKVEVLTASMIPYGMRASKGTPMMAVVNQSCMINQHPAFIWATQNVSYPAVVVVLRWEELHAAKAS